MRLTPSWFRSSPDAPSEERDEDADTTAGVTIYHTTGSEFSGEGVGESDRVGEFLPESNDSLLAIVEGMQTPVTVDEVTDELIGPARPSIEMWAAVHERLHRERLPALDASGDIEFDEAQGLVERPAQRGERNLLSLTALGAISIAFLVVLVALVSTSVLTAVLVTLVTTAAVWFVPG
ncbi:hypothetical protein ACFO5R_21745 [Halosolutus amylolyticus]|uniref:DUF2335 domain-containing protein n=1 Tax=Halosolutus amylolyticus TaxID=2932267 RepID=A0ABD5PVE3_9EURY|nr:hypothetical protein [Halosolutus amylolyticus]